MERTVRSSFARRQNPADAPCRCPSPPNPYSWMPFEADQQSFADQPTRLFLMHARMFGFPVEVFHRRIGGHATMRVGQPFRLADELPAGLDRKSQKTAATDLIMHRIAAQLDPRHRGAYADEQG